MAKSLRKGARLASIVRRFLNSHNIELHVECCWIVHWRQRVGLAEQNKIREMSYLSQSIPLDPFKMWKDMYDQTESNWNEAIQESLKKESFSEGMGETLNFYLQFKELAKKTTETYLQEVNIPTREDLAEVASLVINLEEKVDDLNDKFQDEMSKMDTSKEIKQLKTVVTNLEQKLDGILRVLEPLSNRTNNSEQ